MGYRGRGLLAFVLWPMLAAGVCHTGPAAAQGLDDPLFPPAVKQRFSSVLLPSERALQRIQRRAAGDRTLKRLADAPIYPVGYTDAKGEPTACRLGIGADTDDRIEIPTKGAAASKIFPGHVGVQIEVSGEQGINELVLGGLYNGAVAWKTNQPHVFVKLFWCSKDAGVPDRLLAIVREELEREGIRLLPMRMLDWPAATAAERLSQLLPPDKPPPTAPPAKKDVAPPQGPARVFSSPYDVVAAHNQAVARKDWEAYARCLTPASQGDVIRELIFLASMGGRKKCPELIETIERHLKFKLFNDGDIPGELVQSDESRRLFAGLPPGESAEAAAASRYGVLRTQVGDGLALVSERLQILRMEARQLFATPGKQPDEDPEAVGLSVYEAFRRRVGDVPAFLGDCLRRPSGQPEGVGKPIECEGIRIEGDKASGYWIDRRPVPDAKEAEGRDALHYLPRYFPLHFRRINGSWLIE